MGSRIIMSFSSVRLDILEIENIISTFKMLFRKEDRLWIFGSRVDLNKKGGDIDLYIETNISDVKEINKARIDFITELYYKIGEQKIDVIVHKITDSFSLPIYDIAKQEGVRLV